MADILLDRAGRDFGNDSILNAQVADCIEPGGGVRDSSVCNNQIVLLGAQDPNGQKREKKPHAVLKIKKLWASEMQWLMHNA